MVHVRIVVPSEKAGATLECLEDFGSVISIIHLPRAARRPEGDVIPRDVASEDASLVIERLKQQDVHHDGSIAVELVDTAVSDAAIAAERVAQGSPSDAVILEEVTEGTSESATLSGAFLLFMVLASLIAAVGILLGSPILVVGAMVVGPEFGPVAGSTRWGSHRTRSWPPSTGWPARSPRPTSSPPSSRSARASPGCSR